MRDEAPGAPRGWDTSKGTPDNSKAGLSEPQGPRVTPGALVLLRRNLEEDGHLSGPDSMPEAGVRASTHVS